MMMQHNTLLTTSLLVLALALSTGAEAHRAWLLPSATVLSGAEGWVTVDAAVSNDLFFFEHNPLRLEGLAVTGPDGGKIEPQNASTGRLRSTFDVQMTKPGTYKFAVINDGVFAQYKKDGEQKRWRGRPEDIAKEIPKDAEELKITQSQRRMETFATLGSPSDGALKPSGKGLEMEPLSHPNDLVANSEAKFRLLLDGKPAADVEVSVVRGGIRYRDDLADTIAKTGADGSFSVKWPEPGVYWLEATMTDDKTSVSGATQRRAGYAVTLEVLPE
jgi:uncharacterized GH25 family protein